MERFNAHLTVSSVFGPNRHVEVQCLAEVEVHSVWLS